MRCRLMIDCDVAKKKVLKLGRDVKLQIFKHTLATNHNYHSMPTQGLYPATTPTGHTHLSHPLATIFIFTSLFCANFKV